MKIKRVRITKSEYSTYWYADKIGNEFMVQELPTAEFDFSFRYRIIPVGTQQASLAKYIQPDDCEIIEEFDGFVKEVITTSIIRVDDQQ